MRLFGRLVRLVAACDGLVQLPVKLLSSTKVEADLRLGHAGELLSGVLRVSRGGTGVRQGIRPAGGKMPPNPFDPQANPRGTGRRAATTQPGVVIRHKSANGPDRFSGPKFLMNGEGIAGLGALRD